MPLRNGFQRINKTFNFGGMNTQYNAKYWKEKLDLITHVEGGAFKEVYRSKQVLPQNTLTQDHKGDRNTSTSIYFLLEHGEF